MTGTHHASPLVLLSAVATSEASQEPGGGTALREQHGVVAHDPLAGRAQARGELALRTAQPSQRLLEFSAREQLIAVHARG